MKCLYPSLLSFTQVSCNRSIYSKNGACYKLVPTFLTNFHYLPVSHKSPRVTLLKGALELRGLL